MAELTVNVVTVESVVLHPNADKLELVNLVGKGYQVISGKGNFKVGDLAFYFPIDSVIPDEWVKTFGIENYYSKKIRATKLRGVFSEGLLIPIMSVFDNCEFSFTDGDDYTDYFGVTKYVPPFRGCSGKSSNPIGQYRFPSPEHLKKYKDIFEDGEQVVITEKIHGQNLVIVKDVDSTIKVASHNCFWDDIPENANMPHIICSKQYPELGDIPAGTILYGEVFGNGCQDLNYGRTGIDYALFAVVKDGNFLDYDLFVDFCNFYKLKHTPAIYRGSYNYEVIESCNNIDSIVSTVPQLMEGVCVVPVQERISPEFGRVCMKYISSRYLLRKNGTENK